MSETSMLARMVALVGDAAIAWRRMQGATQSLGTAPTIPVAKPQGRIPTLKMPPARGWRQVQSPVAASGLKRPGHVVKP